MPFDNELITPVLLAGLKERFKVLGVAFPEMAVADNCCHVRSAIQDIFPKIRVLLDVWHFMTRYTVCIMNGTKNPFHTAVAQDIVNAIIKTRADKYNKTEYRSQEEQERRLEAAYEKYVEKGGVWTAAAEGAHRQQLNHVRKGCLARPREDISSDGSRIEGTHKGWNSLQRAHSSGIEVLLALGSDFVLRRNVRTGLSQNEPSSFLLSTHGSHHIGLVNAVAHLWNKMLAETMRTPPAGFSPLPVLHIVDSGESFGLVASKSADSYYQLTDVKDEAEQELVDISNLSEAEREHVLESINTDRSMFYRPLSTGATLTLPAPIASQTLPGTMTPRVPGLSPSARLFALSTGISTRSLTIDGNEEYKLFMKLRKACQWVSHAMSPQRWAIATQEYNAKLKAELGNSATEKVPRALMEKLNKIEKEVLRRTANNDYVSKSSGTETFWREHCEAVMLLFANTGSKKHVAHMCGRCKAIMWPYPSGCDGNHPRGYCSDGVAQTHRAGDIFPPWPQPAGVFSGGDKFHAATFLQVVSELYHAFSDMLKARSSQQPDGAFFFKLFETVTIADAGTVSHLIVQLNGAKYLRIDSLAEGLEDGARVEDGVRAA
ncbi:hypothetical protein DENSPDRAFT_859196 [Dentipellis sp. KUC8613]|nr:hypothetical protein DENSPDRAFT_859196 [Dentipellis sp. KUC8613]